MTIYKLKEWPANTRAVFRAMTPDSQRVLEELVLGEVLAGLPVEDMPVMVKIDIRVELTHAESYNLPIMHRYTLHGDAIPAARTAATAPTPPGDQTKEQR